MQHIQTADTTTITTTTTTTKVLILVLLLLLPLLLQPIYGPMSATTPGQPVPEQTLTHSSS